MTDVRWPPADNETDFRFENESNETDFGAFRAERCLRIPLLCGLVQIPSEKTDDLETWFQIELPHVYFNTTNKDRSVQ